MDQRTGGADALTQTNDATQALVGVVCGLSAALFWALGFAGLLTGWLLLGKPPTALQTAGLVTVLCGFYLAQRPS